MPARDIPRRQSPMELITPPERSQTTDEKIWTADRIVTFSDPSDTLGDRVVEQTVQKLIETAVRLLANRTGAMFRGDCTLWNDR